MSEPLAGTECLHTFFAIAFLENLVLRELAAAFPSAKVSPHELRLTLEQGGEVFFLPFGVVVFMDVAKERRENEIERIRHARPGLTPEVMREDLVVQVKPGAELGMEEGTLTVDRLTPARAGIVALTVAQSAAMEYYERIVDTLFARTYDLVGRLKTVGSVPLRTRPLHRFIGQAITTRAEVLSVLHLLDKPDAVWDDPAMDRIYEDLRDEFDLGDRYGALATKLGSVQEALTLVLDVARDRRLLLLEGSVVLLILLEIVLSLVHLK